jgi:hypothetical protein
VFGIRHHGPGCARSLRAALEELQPDIVLVEGPPDAQAVLPFLTHKEMQPPVALLIYAPEQPKQAVYYPFTHFSPEWQALHFTLERGIPVRFMDLPQAIQLARAPQEETHDTPLTDAHPDTKTSDDTNNHTGITSIATPSDLSENHPEVEPLTLRRDDPLALLAEAAGYSDHELWWEQQIEQRQNMTQLFEGILEAMTALRFDPTPTNTEEAQREAHMRQTIRTAQKEGFQRIAVVCGAWHAPVLVDPGSAKEDAALLNGLKKVRVEVTWIPWTNSRLSYRSGYGAGVTSPGWYEHLWTAPDRITIRWITRAAHLLRKEGLDASSASVIEAVRLAEALAAIRDLSLPGLAELNEAITTALCNGDTSPMKLIRDKLEIGEHLGQVPPETPAVPLQRDLEQQQRRLRLKPSVEITTLDLDLRKETDRARSQLLHRLRLLNLPWGEMQHVSGKSGTFHEIWRLQWQVEFVISLIESNIWGNTIETAATAFVHHKTNTADTLPTLTELLNATILAELPEAVEYLLQAIQTCAAISSDVHHLMNAMPPLARVARYGDVRQTRTEHILPIIDGLFERIVIGLPAACSSLDDDAAQQMVNSIDQVHESLNLLNRQEQRSEWQQSLYRLMQKEDIHGLVRGRCCRLLLEENVLDEEELQRLARITLSPASQAQQAASWIEGVLQGSGLRVLHQDGLWRALDRWMSELAPDVFTSLLPILRRAFSHFHAPERRAMGEKIKHLRTTPTRFSGGQEVAGSIQDDINVDRADSILPVLAQIMGVTFNGH